jgi:uncharacterized membrane protein YfcA
VPSLLIGFIVGAVIATIGWHRERKFEAFSLIAWFRSVTVATGLGAFAWLVDLPSHVSPLMLGYFLTACFVATLERLSLEFYKTYIKADYKPHVICKICHCNVYRIHGKFLRPRNAPTRLEKKLTILSR